MSEFLAKMGLVTKEGNREVNMVSVVILLLLMLGFLGVTFYILISSLA